MHEKKRYGKEFFIDLAGIDKPFYESLFYGFMPAKSAHIKNEDITLGKKLSDGQIITDSDDHTSGAYVRIEEKIAILREYAEYEMQSLTQPIMLAYKKPLSGDRRKVKSTEYNRGLEIIGTNKSIAEALLIQASLAVLKEAGYEDLHVEINSIGDKESLARFGKEITGYYRKHINDLPATCRQLMKTDVLALLGCPHDKCRELVEECPKSINFLSDKSRIHFKEVLEFLEILEIPYTINNSLVANRDYCSETIFEIRDSNPKSHPLAVGIRYDTLAKRMGHKKEIPAVGVCIAYKKQGLDDVKESAVEKSLKPKTCLMHLGFEAKAKSLIALEELRKARIFTNHSLAKDKMAGQASMAEKADAETLIIIGKKEAMEGTAIVRDSVTRSQDAVPLKELGNHLKTLR
jgi:histidyl-tRNA synthetase